MLSTHMEALKESVPAAEQEEHTRREQCIAHIIECYGEEFGARMRQWLAGIPDTEEAPLAGLQRATFEAVFGGQMEAAERMCHTPFHSDGDLEEKRTS